MFVLFLGLPGIEKLVYLRPHWLSVGSHRRGCCCPIMTGDACPGLSEGAGCTAARGAGFTGVAVAARGLGTQDLYAAPTAGRASVGGATTGH